MIVEPSVDLITYTPDAMELLLMTKSTRLQGRQTLEEIKSWPYSKKMEHLAYMHDTIKSSWEFIDYTFRISGVSRVFTHQFVRTRDQAGIDDPAFGSPEANPAVASFAQEAQRTIDASDNGFAMPAGAKEPGLYSEAYRKINEIYKGLLESHESYQDARYVLSNGISTSIIAKLSLRALHHMAEVRLCTRAQGEYQKVFRMMRDHVYMVHPWAKGWIEVYCVNHGTCCFPNYEKCPIQKFTYKPTKDQLTTIEVMWDTMRHEADPVAKDGKTM